MQMLFELLIKAVDAPTLATYPTAAYRRGDVVAAFPSPHSWGAAEKPPTFYLLKVDLPAADVAAVLASATDEDGNLTSRRQLGLNFALLNPATLTLLETGAVVTISKAAFDLLKVSRV
jgi:acyl CoA:acetate/3-ketoacid CoA transferase alpha subunit